MTSQVLEKLCDERDEVRNAAIQIAESDGFNPEDETFVDLQTRAVELDKRVSSLTGLIEARQSADALDGKFARAHQRQAEQRETAPQSRGSWGDIFTRDDAWTGYHGKGSSAIVTIEDVHSRALPTGVTDLVDAGLKGGVLTYDTTAPTAPTPLLNVCTAVQVSGNAIETVQWSHTGSAAVVPEKGVKPLLEFKPTVVPGVLQNIAAATQLTRSMIEDYAAVRSLIDNELRREVGREEEEQAVAALTAADLPTATAGDLLSAIRGGMGTVQAAGYTPDAVMLNPSDWAELDVAIMGATLLGPQVSQRFWGLTPIPAASQAAGTAIVGSFGTAVQHFYRNQIQLFVSDSHGDTFLSNVFTLLAEKRSKTVVVRPQALVEVSG
jgi:HK97 family phage major capsid protein